VSHLASLRANKLITRFDSKESSLHGLVNNAGIMGVPFALTQDGYETQFQVAFLPRLQYQSAANTKRQTT